MLMDVITSPRGSARCGKEWSCRAESIFALKGINLKIVHSEAVHCYMGYFETYILLIIFFMYGGILSLTFSHLYHYWHFPTMVGFCHGGNVLGNHGGDGEHDDDEEISVTNLVWARGKSVSVCARGSKGQMSNASVLNGATAQLMLYNAHNALQQSHHCSGQERKCFPVALSLSHPGLVEVLQGGISE